MNMVTSSLLIAAGILALPFVFSSRPARTEVMATDLSPTSSKLLGGHFEEATFAAG